MRTISTLPGELDGGITSFKLGSDISVWFFNDKYLMSPSAHRRFDGPVNVSNLSAHNLNDKIRSMVIFTKSQGHPPGAMLYKDKDFKGRCLFLLGNKGYSRLIVPDKEFNDKMNDEVSSVALFGGISMVALFPHNCFKGQYLVLLENERNLQNRGFNNITSSVLVGQQKPGGKPCDGETLFEDANCWLYPSPPDEEWVRQQADIVVRTINVHGGVPCRGERLRKIASVIHSEYPVKLGLLGVQELFDVPDCQINPSEERGAACFAGELGRVYGTDIKWDHNKNKNAILHDSEWERISRDYLCVSSRIFGICKKDRWALENVLRHKKKGWILRFYTTHFTNTDEYEREVGAKKLADWVKERAQPGELLPIVTGDFNAGRRLSGGEVEQSVIEMERHFYRPMDRGWTEQGLNDFRHTGIDIIYIGKKSSFPNSYGDYIPINTHNLRFDRQTGIETNQHFCENLTDHPSRALTLRVAGSQPTIGISSNQLVSWGKGRLDYFVRNSEKNLMHLCFDDKNGGWQSWKNLGGQLESDPEVVSWGNGRLDVFSTGENNNLIHIFYDENNGGWGHWENLGSQLYGKPKITSWGFGRLDIFVKGKLNHLKHLWYDIHHGWGNWEDLVGNVVSNPEVISWGDGRLDIFAQGDQSHLYHLWYDENRGGWGHWEDLGGTVALTDPKAVSWSYGRLDVFVRNAGALNHIWYDEYSCGWGHWENLGGQLSFNDPEINSWDYGRLDIFARGTSGHLKHLWYDIHSGWGHWEDKGEKFILSPKVTSWAPGRLDIFVKDYDKHYKHLWHDRGGGGWGHWEDKTE